MPVSKHLHLCRCVIAGASPAFVDLCYDDDDGDDDDDDDTSVLHQIPQSP